MLCVARKSMKLYFMRKSGEAMEVVEVNLEKLFHIIVLSLIEVGLALMDLVKGLYRGNAPGKELKFLFSRIGVCIVLRELVRLRVKIDIARGLPVIHANFVGYDEHSHRRGPDSGFAFWTLKGIDAVVKELVTKAVKSPKRDYQVFIYSDHGQEKCVPYEIIHGSSVSSAIKEVFKTGPLGHYVCADSNSIIPHFYLHQRSRSFLHRSPGKSLSNTAPQEYDLNQIHITAMGPLGHIYLPKQLDTEQMGRYANELVNTAGIPLVLYLHNQQLMCITASVSGEISEVAPLVFGINHPFLLEIIQDMQAICRHEDAGEFIISGWRPHATPVTFAVETGAHGGPGHNETQGFVVLPDMLEIRDRSFFRGLDLRQHIRKILENKILVPAVITDSERQYPANIRIMSYNIHSCIGTDGKLFPARVGRVIERQEPDIVALQEVDNNLPRTEFRDQAALLGEQLGMQSIFYPVLKKDGGEYGLAVLSRYPLKTMKCVLLPARKAVGRREPRGLMWLRLDARIGPMNILNTHLSLYKKERQVQMQHIIQNYILRKIPEKEPILFCGDLNATTHSPAYKALSAHLQDSQLMLRSIRSDSTFISSYPLLRLDHIFHSAHLAPLRVEVVNDWECRLASDHLPVLCQFLYEPSVAFEHLKG